ncbi:MAG: CDP-alcohol phosphatidyltransferase family protein [Trueperaceae bacterium]
MTERKAAKPRPRHEVLMRVVQPLADRGVAWLARTPVDPQHVVLAHTIIGFAAATLLAREALVPWVGAAVLLQGKTLLDNMDGGLARTTGRVTEMGRYLDTVMDLLVNVALFAALATHGPPLLAWSAFVVLTLVLSADHNAERRYREEHGGTMQQSPAPPGAPAPLLAVVRGLYRFALAPQDRFLRSLDARLFRYATSTAWADAPTTLRRRWADAFSTGALVNLGLSTQYLLLGVCAALGAPFVYVVVVLAQAPYVALVQAARVWRMRARLEAGVS